MASRGRCFRDRRRTARRKTRQEEAYAAFQKKFPGIKARGRLGIGMFVPRWESLGLLAKQRIIKGFKAHFKP